MKKCHKNDRNRTKKLNNKIGTNKLNKKIEDRKLNVERMKRVRTRTDKLFLPCLVYSSAF